MRGQNTKEVRWWETLLQKRSILMRWGNFISTFRALNCCCTKSMDFYILYMLAAPPHSNTFMGCLVSFVHCNKNVFFLKQHNLKVNQFLMYFLSIRNSKFMSPLSIIEKGWLKKIFFGQSIIYSVKWFNTVRLLSYDLNFDYFKVMAKETQVN